MNQTANQIKILRESLELIKDYDLPDVIKEAMVSQRKELIKKLQREMLQKLTDEAQDLDLDY